MNTTKYTPGPWVYQEGSGHIYAGDKKIISDCGCCGGYWIDNDSDAALITAAPMLAEALEALLHEDGGSLAFSACNPICIQARAALAAVRGDK